MAAIQPWWSQQPANRRNATLALINDARLTDDEVAALCLLLEAWDSTLASYMEYRQQIDETDDLAYSEHDFIRDLMMLGFSGRPVEPEVDRFLDHESKKIVDVLRHKWPKAEATPLAEPLAMSINILLEGQFDFIFDFPSTRLAVYGTLRPGESNASLLEEIGGEWSDGTVCGRIVERDGYPEFNWSPGGETIAVKVLTYRELPGQFLRLDQFEGENYWRTLVPV